MELAARLAFLGQPVDLEGLYRSTEREYVLFLRAVLSRLSELHRQEIRKAEENAASA